MATPWVILGRVLRVGFVPGDVVAEEVEAAQAEHDADADAQEDQDAAADVDGDEQGEHAAVAAEEEEEEEALVEDVVAVDDDGEEQAEQVAEDEAQEEDVVAVDDEGEDEAQVDDVVAAVEEEEEEEEEVQLENVVMAAVEEEEEEEEVQVENVVMAAVEGEEEEEEEEEVQLENVVMAAVEEEEEEAQVENIVMAAVEEEDEEELEAQVDDVVEEAEDVEGVDAQAEHAAAAVPEQPDFSFPVVLPPRVTVVAAGPGAHPYGKNCDKYPYIVAAVPHFLLVHFADSPFRGTNFGDNIYPTHLVLLRHFQTNAADGLTTASSVRIPGRTGYAPVISNIESLGLHADPEDGRYKIAELNVHKGSERARLISFSSVYHPRGAAEWRVHELEYPVAEENRDWVPHGTVTVDSTIWWFDLSWGILSCDVDEREPDLLFHYIPDGRALARATPDIHTTRAIAVSRDKLRYVEIIVTQGRAAVVCMWTRMIGPDGWNWYVKYAMSFGRIWDDDSYRETGLPRTVPVLAVVCPSNPALVYFALEHRLFGVNVPAHRVVHCQAYDLVNIPDQPPQPPSGRYVVAWNLPPAVAQGLGMDPFAGLHAGQLGAQGGEGLQEGEIEDDDELPVAVIDGDDQPAEEVDFAGPQEAVVLEELQAAAIQTNEQQAEEADGDELLEDGEFSVEQMRRLDITNLAVKMDPETLSRLKAEVKESFRDMDHPGPSQDPEDDAGGSAAV